MIWNDIAREWEIQRVQSAGLICFDGHQKEERKNMSCGWGRIRNWDQRASVSYLFLTNQFTDRGFLGLSSLPFLRSSSLYQRLRRTSLSLGRWHQQRFSMLNRVFLDRTTKMFNRWSVRKVLPRTEFFTSFRRWTSFATAPSLCFSACFLASFAADFTLAPASLAWRLSFSPCSKRRSTFPGWTTSVGLVLLAAWSPRFSAVFFAVFAASLADSVLDVKSKCRDSSHPSTSLTSHPNYHWLSSSALHRLFSPRRASFRRRSSHFPRPSVRPWVFQLESSWTFVEVVPGEAVLTSGIFQVVKVLVDRIASCMSRSLGIGNTLLNDIDHSFLDAKRMNSAPREWVDLLWLFHLDSMLRSLYLSDHLSHCREQEPQRTSRVKSLWTWWVDIVISTVLIDLELQWKASINVTWCNRSFLSLRERRTANPSSRTDVSVGLFWMRETPERGKEREKEKEERQRQRSNALSPQASLKAVALMLLSARSQRARGDFSNWFVGENFHFQFARRAKILLGLRGSISERNSLVDRNIEKILSHRDLFFIAIKSTWRRTR